jgi:cell division protein FtsA
MSRHPIITAIDLGTDKCVTLIATYDDELNDLRVLGVSAVPSRGMRRSQIVDLEKVIETLTESLDAAERMAGVEVKSAYFSISGGHIASQNSKGVVAVADPNQEITPQDVARVIEAARAISLPADREIMHLVPHDFTVDSQTGIKDPVGMTGVRLESQVHIITGMTTALRNVRKCAQDLGIQVAGFMFSGLAAADMVLTETERELGVVLVDIGAGTTSVCAYVDGALIYSSVFPVGARHITQDIALGCRVSLESAEKIKTFLSEDDLKGPNLQSGEDKDIFRKRKKEADKLDISKLNIPESIDSLSKKTLIEGIMVPRMKEIFTLIGKELQHQNILVDVPAGLVLTGGGAETTGIVEVAKRTLNLPARIGKPAALQGLVEDINKPSYATSIGLLLHGHQQGGAQRSGGGMIFTLPSLSKTITALSGGNLGKTIQSFFKSLLP